MAPSRSKTVRDIIMQRGLDLSQRHRAIFHLRELLKLNNSQFIEMREAIEELSSSHFDINKMGRLQTHALDMAMEDLKSRFPVLTKGNIEQQDFLAKRAFLIMHAIHRKRRRNRNSWRKEQKTPEEDEEDARSDTDNDNHSQENKEPDPRSLSSAKPGPSLTQRMAANLLSIKNGSRAPKIFASPSRVLCNAEPSSSNDPVIKLPLSDIQAPSGSLARSQRPPVRPMQTPNPNPDASFSLSSMSELGVPHTQIASSSLDSSQIYRSREIRGEKASFSTPTTSSSSMVAGSSASASCGDTQGCSAVPSAVPPQNLAQIRSVHNFLEAVVPPMTHLLHRFIEFGCLGEDFLFAVSMWEPERIRTFLKSLPPGPGGKALTRMEMEILTYHFESYFLATKV